MTSTFHLQILWLAVKFWCLTTIWLKAFYINADTRLHDLEIREAVAGCEQNVVLKLWVARHQRQLLHHEVPQTRL